jgi:hypothetical protein
MAYEYLNALKDILIYGGVSDADMEKGMVRCDVNVSVRPKGQQELGAKIEIKNMNSFSGVRKALEYEIPPQVREDDQRFHRRPHRARRTGERQIRVGDKRFIDDDLRCGRARIGRWSPTARLQGPCRGGFAGSSSCNGMFDDDVEAPDPS